MCGWGAAAGGWMGGPGWAAAKMVISDYSSPSLACWLGLPLPFCSRDGLLSADDLRVPDVESIFFGPLVLIERFRAYDANNDGKISEEVRLAS